MLTGLLWITACWSPKTTGPNSMVGRVVDEMGTPVAGLTVETAEASTTTDPTGWFGVSYKEPSRFAWFVYDGVTFQRHYRPDADHGDVLVQLPPLAPRALSCEMDAACEVYLTWELDDGLRAIARGPCDPDDGTARVTAPASGLPALAVCRADPGQPDQPLVAVDTGTGIRLTPPPVELTVRLVSQGSTPTECRVSVGGTEAQPLGDGRYTATTFGRVQVDAVCDGRPATPQMVIVRKAAEVRLVWSADAPTLDLRELADGATVARVRMMRGIGRGWTLALPAQPDGTFRLPPLPPGDFTIAAGVAEDRFARLGLAEDIDPDLLQVVEIPQEPTDGARRGVAGMLRTSKQIVGGVVPVTLIVEPEALPASVDVP